VQAADKIFRPKLQNKTIAIGDCVLSPWSENYKTPLHAPGSVRASDSFACVEAGTTRVGKSETRAFDATSN